MKNLSSDVPATTLTLADFLKDDLDQINIKDINESPQARIVEMIAQKAPHLLGEVPLILALCEVYFQKKIR